MSDTTSSGDLRQAIAFADLVTALRRHWVVIAAATAIGALLGVLAGTLIPPTFEASTTMLVEATVVDRTDPEARGDLVEPALEIQLIRSTDVLADAARRLSPPANPEALRRDLVVTNIEDTDLMLLSATAGTANRALQIVEAVTTAYLEQRQQRAVDEVATRTLSVDERLVAAETDLASVNDDLVALAGSATPNEGRRVLLEGRRDVLTAQIITLQQEEAQLRLLNTNPGRITERPRITNDGGLGLALIVVGATSFGLIAGVGLALLRDRTDDRLWNAQDVERIVPDIPVVEVSVEELQEGGLLDGASFREVRDLVISFPVPQATTLVMLSPRTDGAVAYVAAGVASAISRAGLPTVLLDPNGFTGIERTSGWLGVPPNSPARLDDYLFRDVSLDQAAATTDARPNLRVLRRTSDAVDRDVTVAPRLRRLLWRQDRAGSAAGPHEDVSVAVAAPGIIDSPDGAVLGGMGDSVVLVCRARTSTRADLTRSLRQLRTHAASVVAVVMVPTDAPSDDV